MADVIVLRGNSSAEELRGKLVESLGLTREGLDVLGQMEALFGAIIGKIEGDSSAVRMVGSRDILALAKAGKYVAMDIANGLGCEYERISDDLGIPT